MRRTSFLSAFLVMAALQSSAQDRAVIDKRKAVVEAIQAVRRYPEEIRKAVPVVAQHPKLAGHLLDAVNSKASVPEVLASYPQEVQDAGRTLAGTPEVLEIMVMVPALTKAVGEVYAKEGGEALKAKVEAFLKEETPATEASVKAWSRRLAANRTALQQFLDAVSDFMEEKPSPEHQDYGCGVSVSPAKVVVYAMPPGPMTAYLLMHADEFANLADEMFEQWLHTDSSTGFDKAMDGWWGVVRRYFAPELLAPEGRAERLAELAVLAKHYGKEHKPDQEKPQPPTDAEARKFLQEHLNDLPLSGKYLLSEGTKVTPVKEGEPAPKPKVAARPRPAPAVVITPKKPAAVAAKPKPRPERAPLPREVTSEQPSYEQQTRQANQNNYFYWYYYQQPVNPYLFYNPYFYRWPGHRPGFHRPGGGFNRPIRGRR